MTAEFASLLPPNTTRFERVVEQVSGERWDALDVDVIRRAKDPLTCPEHLLNFLAFERSVDVWDEAWPVEKKRQVIADAPEDHRRKGTEDGLDRYVRHAGGELLAVVAPPQGLYAVEGWTEAERAAYLAQLDQVRIHRFYPVDLEPDGLLAGDGFYGEDFYNTEPAWHGYRKHAVYRRADGSETDLDVLRQQVVAADGLSTEIETILLPGETDAGLYAGVDFLGEDFYDVNRLGDRLIEVETPGAYAYSYGRLRFGVVFPKGAVVGVEPELVFELRANDDCGTFCGDDFYGDGFWMPDESWQQVYERYYINNPAATAASAQAGGCYYDDAWWGWAPHTAQATIALIDRQPEFGADEFFDVGFFLPPETERFGRMLDAVASSQRLSDRILVQSATHRWPRLGDRLPLDGSWTLGEMIRER